MTTRWKIALAIAGLALAVALALGLIATLRGGDEATTIPEPTPPVGSAILPDLAPKPQLNVQVQQVGKRWRIRFDTVIVNVGEGDFVLRGTREAGGPWTVEQDVPYSTSGARRVPLRSRVVWGGDGHNHWHIVRVASVWLVPLDAEGRPMDDSREHVDRKVGFCFYDHTHELARGPEKAVYSAHSCGKEDSTEFGMGLSPGWNDTYLQSLPGQDIDVTGLPDGKYRLWTEIDEQAHFRETNRGNNRTWIDLDIHMTPDGLTALTFATGPQPK